MALQGAKGETASRSLASRLVREILEGEYSPFEKLPTERELAERYQVSRHVIREALKRLEALRLLRIQQGSGAYVADVSLTGGLELLDYLLFDDDGHLDFRLIADFMAFWRNFLQEAVRLAAQNRTQEDIDALREAIAAREESTEDFSLFLELNYKVHRLMARATHNRVYQMIFNNLGRAVTQVRAQIPLSTLGPMISYEMLTRQIDAIEQQDQEMAALLCVRNLDQVQTVMREFLTEQLLNS